jgi:hypothetical protein
MFDLDGPLALCVESEYFAWANRHPAVTKPWDYEKLVDTGDWLAATGMMPGESTKLFQEFMQSPACPGFRPTPGAINALATIPARCRLLATARGHLLSHVTREFLDEYYGPFHRYDFNVHELKIALANCLKPKFVIDDCYPLLRIMAQETATTPILFPKPTARQLDRPDGVIILDAESSVYHDMPLGDYERVCTEAWQEISAILAAA